MCDDVEDRLSTDRIEWIVSCMNGRQLHLLMLRSSFPPSSIPLLILVNPATR